jgi:N,N'-diacetyllegionaminate synthase
MKKRSAFKTAFPIGGRTVGAGAPCIVVAEIGPNHDGDSDKAHRLIEAAAACGCDAVKFQYRIADAEIFDRTTMSYYFNEPRYDFIKRVQELPHKTHAALRRDTKKRGMLYLCSAMSEQGIDRIADLDADALKIPSGEVGNPWLLERAGKTGLPIVASSGMSPQTEIDAMMRSLGEHSHRVVLLHCLSEYPTRLEDMNLRVIPLFAERFKCPVGLSDHSRRLDEVAASVALGGSMIEVHFTFDRKAKGPDHHISLLPREMTALVHRVRDLEQALGKPEKILGQHVNGMRQSFTNCIVARRDIAKGEVLDRAVLALKKPGTGLPPTALPKLLGKRAARKIPANAPLTWTDVA